MHLRNSTIVGLTLLAVLSRLIPHPPNFACVGAIGLFAGAYFRSPLALLVPLAALLASDALIGFYSPLVMAFVYSGFVIGAAIGRIWLRTRVRAPRLIALSLFNSGVFFVLSNFGCWLAGMYPPTVDGLVTCYVMALPFLANTVVGDLLFAAALFGGYELVRRWAARRAIAWEAA